MLEGYRLTQNAHGLQALLKRPVFPAKNMSIAQDDEMSNVPLLIFRDQHLPMPGPTVDNPLYTPYEKAVGKGSGETLSMEDFETENFTLGDEYDSLI